MKFCKNHWSLVGMVPTTGFFAGGFFRGRYSGMIFFQKKWRNGQRNLLLGIAEFRNLEEEWGPQQRVATVFQIN
jgi:hypothetical protein